MANSNASGVLYFGDGRTDGACLGVSSSAKVGFYGKTPTTQAANIAAATSSVTTTAFNQLLSILSNTGLMAAS